jgi:hypothetical protein
LVEARTMLSEEAFVSAIELVIATAPAIRPEIRERVIALLTAGAPA